MQNTPQLLARRLFLSAALLLFPAFASGQSGVDSALSFIQQIGVGGNLRGVGGIVARRTNTYAVIVGELGEADAKQLVDAELDKAIEDFQGEWDRKLAESYAEHLSPEELASLAQHGKKSPHIKAVLAKQKDIGASMEPRGKSVLHRYVTQAMAAAYEKAGKH